MSNAEKIARGLKAFADAKAAHARKDYPEASNQFQRALLLMPNHPQVLADYGKLAEEVEDWNAAEKICRKLGELRPDSNFEGSLANALFKLGRCAESVPLFEIFVRRNPRDADAMHALSCALSGDDRWEEALVWLRKASALKPNEGIVEAELNALYHLARTAELDQRLNVEMAKFPESRGIRSLYALHKLKAGEFGEGFRYFNDLRWRNNQKGWARLEAEGKVSGDWDGKPFDGTLIINAEQGIGDELMLSSMFDDIIASGQDTLVECDDRLVPLYQRAYPQLRFASRMMERTPAPDDGRPTKSIAALDAAFVFRNTRDRFPDRHSWLRADPERQRLIRETYRTRWPGKRLVGISWKSIRAVMEGASKNIDLTALAAVLSNPDCVFINLQYGDVSTDLEQLRAAGLDLFVDPAIDSRNDIEGLAAQIAALDLVISISNTTVHLAGALGVPCWLMLPKTRPILWYWGYRGETTPWYPSVKIFRCAHNNDWRDVIDNVARELQSLPDPEP